jgi:putative toxin-antitoxin system antitoxin component (TIGR02293 family)
MLTGVQMNSAGKSIASPKKGKVTGEKVKRDASSGRFIDIKSLKRSKLNATPLASMITGTRSGDSIEMQSRIKKGLKFAAIAHLGKALAISQKEVAQLLFITPSTLNRRKKDGLLHHDESDRVVRFARLKDAALTLMQGDDHAAVAWLHTPLDIFGGESPLDYATTELGARDVEDLIGRLRHGVFS